MKSTSRHIFEKVLICIERGMYSVHFKEMSLFKNFKSVLFSPASLAVPTLYLAWRRKGTPLKIKTAHCIYNHSVWGNLII